MKLITVSYLFRFSNCGAHSKIQIEALGLSYPQANGWMQALEGSSISDLQAKIFEEGRGVKSGSWRYHELKDMLSEHKPEVEQPLFHAGPHPCDDNWVPTDWRT